MAKDIFFHKYLLSHLQNIIAPSRCMGCLKEGTWLCLSCNLNKPSFTLRCIICKEISPRGATCRNCKSASPLHGVVNAGAYKSHYLRRGVHWLKFKNIKSVAFSLSQILVIPLLEIAPLPVLQRSAIIMPIPLHYKKQNQRGFNQSLEIATGLSSLTRIPVHNILERQKHTLTQTKLPLKLRDKNTRGAFILTKEIPQNARYIIILDDVTTSGSTLTAAANALTTNSTQEIWGLTVAKG